MAELALVTLDEIGGVAPRVADIAAQLAARHVTAGDFHELGALLDERRDTSVLVAAVDRCETAHLERLAVIHEERPATQIVLVVDRPSAALVAGADTLLDAARLLTHAGVGDVLVGPVDGEELSQAVKRAASLAESLERWWSAAADGAGSNVGTVHAVTSARGGAGRTFFAVNLAALLAHATGERVCLVDLDIPVGDAALVLGLEPRYSVADLPAATDEAAALIEQYAELHASGLHVLAAPPVEDADTLDLDSALNVVRAARRAFDHVVVDLQPATAPLAMAVMREADERWCIAKPDIPSIRTLVTYLSAAGEGVGLADVKIVLNMVTGGSGLEPEDVDGVLPSGLAAALPYSRRASKATNEGTTIYEIEPSGELARRLHTLFAPWTGANGSSSSARREHGWRRLLAGRS